MSEPEVRTDSDNPLHAKLFQTISLLAIEPKDAPKIYFVVEGLATFESGPRGETSDEMLQSGQQYFFEEHTCPTNFICIPLIVSDGDPDPHGLFEHVRSVWMPAAYHLAQKRSGERQRILFALFPEMGVGATEL